MSPEEKERIMQENLIAIRANHAALLAAAAVWHEEGAQNFMRLRRAA